MKQYGLQEGSEYFELCSMNMLGWQTFLRIRKAPSMIAQQEQQRLKSEGLGHLIEAAELATKTEQPIEYLVVNDQKRIVYGPASLADCGQQD
jgi:hypothetical protein